MTESRRSKTVFRMIRIRIRSGSELLLHPLFLVAVLIGSILRLYQLTIQIPADDEWHSIHKVLYLGYVQIAGSFGGADHCIPLTLFYEFFRNNFFLSELVLRLPLMGAGLLSLVIIPLLLKFIGGTRVSAIMALLLAVSPLHIYFSRYARPYSIVLLLSTLGVLGFYRWWLGGGKLWQWVYILAAVIAPYFHLTALPFVNIPILFGLIESLRGKVHKRPKLPQILLTGFLVALGQALLLMPPALQDFHSVEEKLGAGALPGPGTIEGALQLFMGSGCNSMVVLMLAIALAGLLFALQIERRFVFFIGLIALFQVIVTLALLPAAIHIPIVLARYSLGLLPFTLWFQAIALDRLASFAESRIRKFPTQLVLVALGFFLFYFGPLPRIYYYPNNWTNHGLFQYSYDWQDTKFSYRNILEPESIPAFYCEIAEKVPGSMTILEAPWYYEWDDNHFPFYQMVHRQKMVIGFVAPLEEVTRPGEFHPELGSLRFKSFVHVGQYQQLGEIEDLAFVVFHKDLAREVPHAAPREPIDINPWIQEYRKRFGESYYEDKRIVVFKVKKDPVAK